jgi:hypothetical protein
VGRPDHRADGAFEVTAVKSDVPPSINHPQSQSAISNRRIRSPQSAIRNTI